METARKEMQEAKGGHPVQGGKREANDQQGKGRIKSSQGNLIDGQEKTS